MSSLRTAPWLRAPVLLLRRPVVAAAVAGSCVLLAIAAASGPLFLASVGSAALQRNVSVQCPEADMPSLSRSDVRSAAAIKSDDAAVRSAMAGVGLPVPYRVTVAQPTANLGRQASQPLTFYGRRDALDHVQKLRGTGGSGVWISDLEAGRQNVRLGDPVVVGGVRTSIVGVYQDLAGTGFGAELPSYWCSWSSLILPSLETRPPPFLIADEPTMARLATGLAVQAAAKTTVLQNTARPTWYSPVPAGQLTLAEADDVLARRDRLTAAVHVVDPVSGTPGFLASTRLDDDRNSALTTRDGVGGAITPVALAGVAVAVLLVAAAASFWVDQRRPEIRLLGTRGVSPAALGGKACLEMALPALTGTAVGWAAAIGLIKVLGPTPRLEPTAPLSALLAIIPALALGTVALAAVAAVRSAGLVDTPRPRLRSRRLWALLPWELVLVGLGIAAFLALRRDGAVVISPRGVIKVNPMLVAFPLLAMTGVLLLLARGATGQLPRLRRWSGNSRVPMYLAIRRLAGLRSATAAVLVATAVPIGILVYATSVTRSMNATVTAKSATYAGADHALVLGVRPGQTFDLDGTGTQVSVIRDVTTPASTDTEVLGVDPDTFARFAYPARSALGSSLPRLVADLDRSSQPGAAMPAIAVRCPSCGPTVEMALGRSRLTARVVATADLFPGIRVRDAAVLVVPRDRLTGLDPYANRTDEVWTTTGQLPAALDTLRRLGLQTEREITPAQFIGVTQLLPVSWTFDYLQALAVLTGLIAVTGLFLYLPARQRSTLVSYVLLRRIGISRRTHLASLGSELGGVLTVGWTLGVAAALAAMFVVFRLLDVNPNYPPGGLLIIPALLLGLSLLLLLAVALIGSLSAQRTADTVRPAVLLRGASE